MTIAVSEPTSNDRANWESLYCGYAEFYKVPMNKEILDNVWSWIFDDDNKFYAFLAKDHEGNTLGLMHYREMPSPLRGKAIGFLDDLFVLPENRGLGVADALFRALELSANRHNWPMVRWITADNNYRGRGVYDKIAERTSWITYQMPTK